jgi:trehalose 6-phosphate synthase/phosphatase
MARLLIVSNRVPITVRVVEGEVRVERSAGGLATGLKGPHEPSEGLWIGWPGDLTDLDPAQQRQLAEQFVALRIVPVALPPEEIERYYEGVCNGLIWPLFHYLVGQLPLHPRDLDAYERANERFADVVAEQYRPGDLVWIHDYQLMLVPELLRARVPGARIGFFLHIPFPSPDLFRILPNRERLLAGLLGADLIGFHTASYLRHFASSALRVLGAAPDPHGLSWRGRRIRTGVFPMGIDAAAFSALAEQPAVVEEARALRGDPNVRVLVGIDRLDYTKGIPRRLLAFERLLEDHPELRERVRLVQVAVPSQTNVEAYQEFRDQVDGLIGRIHGAFATARWSPIHYLFRGLEEREVVTLYRAADVMLVTPIRDGMNLVAKEFVAARPDEDGVLVLSEFAGAADELAEAVHVNPYDIERSAEAYYEALMMPPAERRARMRGLRRRVLAHDVHRWVASFLEQLERAEPAPDEAAALSPSPPDRIRELLDRLRAAPHLGLLLDYDGTLVPFAPTPELAAPDRDLVALLRALAARPETDVHVVSGRTWATLEAWLGSLPLALHAEHGLWSRERGSAEWTQLELPPATWRPAVLAILEDFAARTPGSLVEEKTASLAWHYRMAEADYGASQARELMVHLTAVLSNEPVEILPGQKVVEVRPHGIHKGRVVERVVAALPPGATLVALGDDRTDEDLFAALPPEAIAVHVGPGASAAAIRLASPRAARDFLAALLERRAS